MVLSTWVRTCPWIYLSLPWASWQLGWGLLSWMIVPLLSCWKLRIFELVKDPSIVEPGIDCHLKLELLEPHLVLFLRHRWGCQCDSQWWNLNFQGEYDFYSVHQWKWCHFCWGGGGLNRCMVCPQLFAELVIPIMFSLRENFLRIITMVLLKASMRPLADRWYAVEDRI